MMVAAVLTGAGMESPAQRLAGAATLSMMVGAVLIIAGAFRLGAIADFLSRPVLVGNINGIALVLVISQLPGVLGVPSTEQSFVGQTVHIASKIREVHTPTLWLSGTALALLLLLRKALPQSGSDARTAINDAAGSRTQAAGYCCRGRGHHHLLPRAHHEPHAKCSVLGAVVITSASSLFDLPGFVRIWRVRPLEGGVAVATFVGVLVLGILPGVLVAVALAVADLIRRAAHPHDAVLGRIQGKPGYHDIEQRPGSETLPGLIIYRLDAPLFFANARFLRDQVHQLIDTAETPVRWSSSTVARCSTWMSRPPRRWKSSTANSTSAASRSRWRSRMRRCGVLAPVRTAAKAPGREPLLHGRRVDPRFH